MPVTVRKLVVNGVNRSLVSSRLRPRDALQAEHVTSGADTPLAGLISEHDAPDMAPFTSPMHRAFVAHSRHRLRADLCRQQRRLLFRHRLVPSFISTRIPLLSTMTPLDSASAGPEQPRDRYRCTARRP